jgi:uncharacterized lipoprotein YddW (UPF0748 family)
MASNKSDEPKGCGCANIPLIPLFLLLSGGGFWLWKSGNLDQIGKLLPQKIPMLTASPLPTQSAGTEPTIASSPSASTTAKPSKSTTSIPSKAIRANAQASANIGIYLSRYQVTNNADEQTIRQRVRFYRSQGINTIIHGVWGNGCTMYKSAVTQKLLGQASCPNQFNDRWLDWMIDEAQKQGMEVHGYFEKGIKIDKNSPIYAEALAKKWLVPGVDKTYSGIDHYVLDVEIPEVAALFKGVVTEFVQKYPKIKAVQWDDYLGYHAELPGAVDRTAKLTRFAQEMIAEMKQANSAVSFDLCHHNPYWAKRYFAADWKNWKIDRAFIQAYNEANFKEELAYAEANGGIALTDRQLSHVPELIKNPKIKAILIFPFSGDPSAVAEKYKAVAIAK